MQVTAQRSVYDEIMRAGRRHRESVKDMADEQLLIAYRERYDRDAFDELVSRYDRPLHCFLRRFLGNAAAADDAYQATFLQVHLKCDQFESDRRVRPWLFKIATNQAIDLQRRNKKNHEMIALDWRPGAEGKSNEGDDTSGSIHDLLAVEDVPEPVEELIASERKEWIRKNMKALPEHLQDTMRLVYFKALKYREVAAKLEVPIGTVKSRLNTAIKTLTNLREKEFGDMVTAD